MIYVISDIHGDYPSFYKMLLKINFSSSDSLCILGDVVDKGSDNLYLLENAVPGLLTGDFVSLF